MYCSLGTCSCRHHEAQKTQHPAYSIHVVRPAIIIVSGAAAATAPREGRPSARLATQLLTAVRVLIVLAIVIVIDIFRRRHRGRRLPRVGRQQLPGPETFLLHPRPRRLRCLGMERLCRSIYCTVCSSIYCTVRRTVPCRSGRRLLRTAGSLYGGLSLGFCPLGLEERPEHLDVAR